MARARAEQGQNVARMFADAKVSYPPKQLYLRGFKHERQLELWAGGSTGPLRLVHSFPFCSASGELGPKRRQGDLQVPEGFYEIDRFNRQSNFLLSLGVSYPNASDRLLGSKGRLGGDIFIHGACVSIGCIAIEDGPVQQLFLVALDARGAGAGRIAVHLFPRRLDEAGLEELKRHPAAAEHLGFWRSLQPAYQWFEQHHRVPKVGVDPRTGAYQIHPG